VQDLSAPAINSAIARLGYSYSTAGFDFAAATALISRLETPSKNRAEEYRRVIELVARECAPSWLSSITAGRIALTAALDADAAECFSRAGAFATPPDQDVLKWLDSLAAMARMDEEIERVEIGRIGELLSFNIETSRLRSYRAHPPVEWTALEDNTAGFDIRSYVFRDERFLPKFIEVKTCSSGRRQIWLTRKEWETAKRFESAYWVHVWSLETQELRELRFEELAAHVPEDAGRGRWMQTLISLDE
jgi:hypothetical protein